MSPIGDGPRGDPSAMMRMIADLQAQIQALQALTGPKAPPTIWGIAETVWEMKDEQHPELILKIMHALDMDDMAQAIAPSPLVVRAERVAYSLTKPVTGRSLWCRIRIAARFVRWRNDGTCSRFNRLLCSLGGGFRHIAMGFRYIRLG